MKAIIASLVMLSAVPAMATVTLQTQFGVAFNTSGVAVPDGTLWALVVDTNGDSTFAGNFGLNSTLSQSGANAAFSQGQTFSIGSLFGNDTVFAIGGFSSAGSGITGVTAQTLNLTLGVNGLALDRNFAFYWFPGVTYAGGNSGSIGSQIGGIHRGADAGASLDGMIIPADSNTTSPGAATGGDLGGSVTNAQFTAVPLIPEPSAALLGLLGAVGLFRRRR